MTNLEHILRFCYKTLKNRSFYPRCVGKREKAHYDVGMEILGCQRKMLRSKNLERFDSVNFVQWKQSENVRQQRFGVLI